MLEPAVFELTGLQRPQVPFPLRINKDTSQGLVARLLFELLL